MSGSGGFYKYPCKNYYDANDPCHEWVLVNDATCARCLARGRSAAYLSTETFGDMRMFPRQICVPHVRDGTLQYTLMEVIHTNEPTAFWTLRLLAARPHIPTVIHANDGPAPIYPSAGVPMPWSQ